MFGLVTTISAAVISFAKRRSTWAFVLIFSWCWLLFAFSQNNADSSIYLVRYYNYDLLLEQNEPLWNMLMYLFNFLNLSYTFFLIFVSSVYMFSIYFLLRVFSTKRKAIPILILFIIFPFCIEIVQVRNSLGFAFVNIGLYYLLRSDDKLDMLRFLAFVLIGTWIHSAMVIYLSFILLKWSKFNVKKPATWIVSFLLIGVLSFLLYKGPLYTFLKGLDIEKINIVLSLSETRTTQQKISQVMRVGVYFVMIITLLIYAYHQAEEKNKKFILDLIGLNLIVLIIVPIMAFSIDFYRLQRNLTLLNLIGVFTLSKKRLTKLDWIMSCGYYCGVVAFIGINFYLQIWRTSDYYGTVVPMIRENIIFLPFNL
ncbi:MAG: EpsG family protein [Bacilli bacterium]